MAVSPPKETIKDIKRFLKKEAKRFTEFYDEKIVYNTSKDDFELIKTLGVGSYGRVLLVKHITNNKYHALKILSKKRIVMSNQIEHTLNEKKILQSINHPFLVHMNYYFSDNSYIYFVLPLVNGGEMFGLLKKMRMFNESLSKFYAAQVCLGLEYLHSLQLVYRDIKPENILIDDIGYIKITDFGLCKLLKGKMTYTFCGTPEYLAPEMVLNRGYGMAVDWWAYGILVYEMSCGYAPFHHRDPLVLYDKIVSGKYKTPHHFSISLRSLLFNILQPELSKRFGNLRNGANDIKDHRWFNEINYLSLINKTIEAPYKPQVSGPSDASNFDVFADEPLRVSEENHYVKEFINF